MLGFSRRLASWTKRFPAITTKAAHRRWWRVVSHINSLESPLQSADDEELRRQSLSLRYRALSGESHLALLPAAFALMREAARRTLDMRHFDVQLLGGIAMCHGAIAEMQTGEGKTLTATLPLYLAALEDKGAHLATSNDYLAARDAEIMRPAYQLLGMTVGVVEAATARTMRQKAYRCDVTYAASREFGFDFLRDRLLLGKQGQSSRDLLGGMLGQRRPGTANDPVQRGLHFVLVDEADSILIDEARTPLIVSSLPGNSQDAAAALYRWAATVTPAFMDAVDYEYDHQERSVTLRPPGRRKVRELEKPDAIDGIDRALRDARRRNRHRRREHGTTGGRPQMARWHPSSH
ncbi:MAG: hypothetical protein HYV60_04670 [Planctomycetia bacterium]|nr:hypothetical protein [Planctomycetia bacterium]